MKSIFDVSSDKQGSFKAFTGSFWSNGWSYIFLAKKISQKWIDIHSKFAKCYVSYIYPFLLGFTHKAENKILLSNRHKSFSLLNSPMEKQCHGKRNLPLVPGKGASWPKAARRLFLLIHHLWPSSTILSSALMPRVHLLGGGGGAFFTSFCHWSWISWSL